MDAEVTGLGVKVTETGSRTFVLIKRYPGYNHPAPRQLGSCDALSLEEARRRLGVAEAHRPWDRPRSRTNANCKRPLRESGRIPLPPWSKTSSGKSLLANVRAGALSAICARNSWRPGASGRLPISSTKTSCRLYVGQAARVTVASPKSAGLRPPLFDWAIDQQGYGIKSNPCAGLKPARLVGEKRARERVLTDDELFAFWRVTGHMGYPAGPLYRLLILTGLRLNEVADAKWSEFDLRNGVWIVPAARMKGKDGRAADHVAPITDDIAAILKSLPRFKSGDYLFSVTFGKTPYGFPTKSKSVSTLACCARCGHGTSTR